MSPDLESRLRSARRPVSPPSPSVTTKAEAALLDRFARNAPRKRRLPAWLPMRRLVGGTAALAALAGGISLLVAHPWLEDGTTVRISLGKDATPSRKAITPADDQPAIPVESGEVPAMVKANKDSIAPGTLRRRVFLDRPEGRYQIWTWTQRDSGEQQTFLIGKGYIQGSAIHGCDAPNPEGSPISQCVGGRGTGAWAVGGRLLDEVAKVEIRTSTGPSDGVVANGYWIAVGDTPYQEAFQIHAFKASGAEVARLPGANPETTVPAEPKTPLPAAAAGPTVPDLSGLSLDEATTSLERLGFAVRRETLSDYATVSYALVPASGSGLRAAKGGEVVRQTPTKGVAMPKGRTVVLSSLGGAPPASFDAKVFPVNAPDLPVLIGRLFSDLAGPEGFRLSPVDGTLRRRLSADFPTGRLEVWTVLGRRTSSVNSAAKATNADLPELENVITFGSAMGTGAASGEGPRIDVDKPGAFPLVAAMSSGGVAGMTTSGFAGHEVASVSTLYADGEGYASLGGGAWVVMNEEARGIPLGLIARDAAGHEIARLGGSAFRLALSSRPTKSVVGGPGVPEPVSSDLVTVPTVTVAGPADAPSTSEAATRRLEDAGFAVKVRSIDSSGFNGPNVVIAQIPEGGSAMKRGGTVLLDVTAPALPAPAALIDRVAHVGPIAVAPQPTDGMRVGVVDFSTTPAASWIINGVQEKSTSGAVLSGGRYVSSPDAPKQSVVLWKPGKEGEAATIARRLGITNGATTDGLPSEFLATPEDSNADPAKPTYDVLVVLGTTPLKKPAAPGP